MQMQNDVQCDSQDPGSEGTSDTLMTSMSDLSQVFVIQSRILVEMFIVADDCISTVRLIKWKLEAAFGKEIGVVMAADGIEAVAAFENLVKGNRQSDIDAVLMDYHMPYMSGLDAINMIRTLEAEYGVEQPVTIIGFSADVSDEMNDMFMRGGANYLIEKPPEPGALEELCQDIINKRKSRGKSAPANNTSSSTHL